MERFLSYVKVFGTGGMFVVTVILAFNYWGCINLAKIPFTHVTDFLYGYLIFGGLGGVLNPFRRRRPEADKRCPQCNSALQSKPHYVCPQCGDLQFKQKENEQSI